MSWRLLSFHGKSSDFPDLKTKAGGFLAVSNTDCEIKEFESRSVSLFRQRMGSLDNLSLLEMFGSASPETTNSALLAFR